MLMCMYVCIYYGQIIVSLYLASYLINMNYIPPCYMLPPMLINVICKLIIYLYYVLFLILILCTHKFAKTFVLNVFNKFQISNFNSNTEWNLRNFCQYLLHFYRFEHSQFSHPCHTIGSQVKVFD